jgi:putative membrane protein
MAAADLRNSLQQMNKSVIAVLCVLSLPLFSFAHGDEVHEHSALGVWTFDPLVIIVLVISGGLYVAGLRKLWRASATGSGVSRSAAAYFAAGWLSLVAALISPIHAWGETSFSAHMTQHEILMLVSAPLIVLGRPFIASLWAFPKPWRSSIGTAINSAPVQSTWRVVSNAGAAWLIHAAALWIWHIPYLFQATLESNFVHMLQHLSFFGSALLFWWAIIYGHRGAASYGAGILYLFTTSIHSGLLGAFLTFTHRVWYPAYALRTEAWGLTPIEDQQLGGLIMWVPAGLVYIGAALVMFSGWLRASEDRMLLKEGRSPSEAAAKA